MFLILLVPDTHLLCVVKQSISMLSQELWVINAKHTYLVDTGMGKRNEVTDRQTHFGLQEIRKGDAG